MNRTYTGGEPFRNASPLSDRWEQEAAECLSIAKRYGDDSTEAEFWLDEAARALSVANSVRESRP